MKKLVLSMNKEEFYEAMTFMYDVFVKNRDIIRVHDMSPRHIAYISYYSEEYNNVFSTLIKSEQQIVENIITFINRINSGVYDIKTSDLSKIIDIAYCAIHDKDILRYFTSDCFPAVSALDEETIINNDIIPSILAIVEPKINRFQNIVINYT